MSNSQHPLVSDYLRRFDAAASALPAARRSLLREEIEAHLRESIGSDLLNAEAAAVISEFGSPAEIIAQELDNLAPSGSKRPRPWMRPLIAVSIIAAVALAVPVGAVLIDQYGADSHSGSPSVVNENPQGLTRVTEGHAYFQYLAAIESMEHPLPPGATYPIGVPAGLDAGPVTDPPKGIMESGAGTHLAHFTWLCAWESEYLAAFEEKDFKRQVKAETMLTSFADSVWYRQVGWGSAWVETVINPMKFNDPSGVKQDRTDTCAQAAIFNSRN